MSDVVITAALVKELRERTSAGMMECKRALEKNKGDIEKSIEDLRKSGQAKADKKTGITAEGIIISAISPDKKQGVLLEINCQTDFVARDSNFVQFARETVQKALDKNISSIENLTSQLLDNGQSIEENRRALVAKIGENVQLRRLEYLHSDQYALISYIHGGRIGAIVEIEGNKDKIDSIGKDIAMHIVASGPLVLNAADISQELIEKEKEIFTAQAAASGKPANIIEKMVEGRIKKYQDEISLTGQPFVKNPDESAGKFLESHHCKVHNFVRFSVGEGIEKKTENFAEEVMAQVKGK